MNRMQKVQTGSTMTDFEKLQVEKFINRLMSSLKAIFPAQQRFTESEYNQVKRQWALGLIDAKTTEYEVIKGGLKKARQHNSPYFPSVGMFIAWCREAYIESLDVPTLDKVHRELGAYQIDSLKILDKYSYWCWTNLDKAKFKRVRSEASMKMLDGVYKEMIDLVLLKHKFPEQVKELVHQEFPKKTQKDIEFGEKSLTELKKQL